MRIGLNATCFNDRPSGAKQRFIGIYSEIFSQMPDDEFIIFEPYDCRMDSWFASSSNIKFVKTPIPSQGRIAKAIRGIFYWPKITQDERLDIFEIFNLPFIRSSAKYNFVTIHDLRGLGPEYNFFYNIVFKSIFKYALLKADRIITGSSSIKDDLKILEPSCKISVIYNGVHSNFYKNIDYIEQEKFKKKYNIHNEFFLTVGHFEKRKNYSQLINAFSLIDENEIDKPLIIIGNDNGELSTISNQIIDLGLERRIHLLSGLSDHEVHIAYTAASLFIFPSAYEGFGIPIVEAMASETPIILSDIPVFREVTEDKGIYFVIGDDSSLAEKIKLLDQNTKIRQSVILYGNNRVKDFSFKKIAAQLKNLYREISFELQ